jgi:2'-5' RNA ligase
VRTFVALEIPADARQRIAAVMDALRPRLRGVRWLRPERVHLTLRFLGEATDAQVEAMAGSLAEAAARCTAARVEVGGLGMFPERGSPKVLWLDSALPASMLALQCACEEAAVGCGFAPENKAFRPHITLGRWPDRVRRPLLPEVAVGTVVLQSLVLYKSELHPRGAIHTSLRSFALPAPPGSWATLPP